MAKSLSDLDTSDEDSGEGHAEADGGVMVWDDGLDSFKAAFGIPPKLPTTGFSAELARRQRDRWAGDHSIATDQIGPDAFSALRSAQLSQFPGAAHLAAVYGARTAMRLTEPAKQPGLRALNTNSSNYQRGNFHSRFQSQCALIYRRALEAEGRTLDPSDEPLTVFAHSEGAFRRVRAQVERDPELAEANLELDSLPGVHGLVAIRCGDFKIVRKVGGWVQSVGGTPSNYEVLKLSGPPTNVAEVPDPTLSNDILLTKIVSPEEGKPIAASAILPPRHPMRAVARAEAALVNGLLTTFESTMTETDFRHSPIIGNSLRMLDGLVATASTMTEDSPRFFSLYQAIVDEIFIILAVARPYGETEFKTAARRALSARIGSGFDGLQIAQPESYLVSSGMEALAVGFDAGRTLAGAQEVEFLSPNEIDRLPDYFEVPGIVAQTRSPSTRVLAAVLNPSTPRRRAGAEPSGDSESWNVETLVQALQVRMPATHASAEKPLVLVLDVSIEKPGVEENTSDLARLVLAYQADINAGRLKLVLCKSYQKYPSLATGKMMAGSVTVLARDDEATRQAADALRRNEADTAWMQNDESQLLTHFIQHGSTSELELLGNAASNASFIGRTCLRTANETGYGFDRFEAGLPFGIIADAEVKAESGKWSIRLSELIQDLAEPRSSFGFLETTCTEFTVEGSMVTRISVGQESRAELMEAFFGLGRMLARDRMLEGAPSDAEAPSKLGPPVRFDLPHMLEETHKIAAAAATIVMERVPPEVWVEQALRILRLRAAQAQRSAEGEDATRRDAEEAGQRGGMDFVFSGIRELLTIIVGCISPEADFTDDIDGGQDAAALVPRLPGRTPPGLAPDASVVPHEVPESDLRRIERLLQQIGAVGPLSGVGPGPEDPEQPARQTKLAESREALRELLQTALAPDEGTMEGRLGENLALAGIAFRPRLSRPLKDTDNLDAVRAGMVRDPEGLEAPADEDSEEFGHYAQARYAANMVASVLAVTSLVVTDGGEVKDEETRAALEAAHSDVLEAGMTSLSPGGRLRLVLDWARLQQRPMANADDATLARIVDRFSRHAAWLPNAEQKVQLLRQFPEGIFNNLGTSAQDSLTAATFGALDGNARLDLIKSLATASEGAKVGSCLRYCSRDLAGITPVTGLPRRGGERVRPDTIGELSRDDPGPVIETRDADAQVAARADLLRAVVPKLLAQNFRGFARNMVRWAPHIADDEALSGRLTSVATKSERLFTASHDRYDLTDPTSEVSADIAALRDEIALLDTPFRAALAELSGGLDWLARGGRAGLL